MITSMTTVLALMVTASAEAQSQDFISIAFKIDGKPATCKPFGVELRLDGKAISPQRSGEGFYVPEVFKKTKRWSDDQRVDITLSCDEHTFAFPQRYPAFVRANDWELGIARPLYAIERFRRTLDLERGTWLAYLIFEGEPGVVTFAPQSDPPTDWIETMQNEHSNASGKRARDIAYSLAIFGVEYEKNRDYLLRLLDGCLTRPRESPEDDECDSELLDFVTNLYWRGDDGLLMPLLRLADTRRDVIGEIGTFYSDLLDRRKEVALTSIEGLGADQQHLVCTMAYDDDLSIDIPKRDRVRAFLTKTPGDAAARCSAAIKE